MLIPELDRADAGKLRNYMVMAEQRIGAAFVAEGLYVHLASAVQGPHTLTYAITLYQPTTSNVARALRLAPPIEAAIGDGPVRVYSERGAIFVETPSPWPENMPATALRGRGLAVPLGLTSRQTVAGVDFAESPHLLLVGPTGRGKTVAARSLIYHLCKQNRPAFVAVIIVTAKPADWVAYANLPNTWAMVTEPAEVQALLDWLNNHIKARAKQHVHRPHIFCVMDDLLNALASAPGIVTPLAEIASLGRAAGIHLILATQRLGKRGAGDAAVTGNVTTRLIFGTADAQDAAFFTGRGDSGAERLGRYPGDALLINDGGATRLAVARVTDQDLAALLQDADSYRPWATTDTTVAAVARERGANGRAALENPPLQPGCEPVATVAPVAGVALPLPPRPAANDAERQAIKAIYADTGSKSETCRRVWGFKDGKTWAWLNDVIGGDDERTA